MIDRTNRNEKKETLYTSTPNRNNHSGSYERTGTGYNTHTLTEKRSDSVIKGIIALLSFLALLWLAYGIISSTMHRSHYKVNNDAAMRSPAIEQNLDATSTDTGAATTTNRWDSSSTPVTTKTTTTEQITQ